MCKTWLCTSVLSLVVMRIALHGHSRSRCRDYFSEACSFSDCDIIESICEELFMPIDAVSSQDAVAVETGCWGVGAILKNSSGKFVGMEETTLKPRPAVGSLIRRVIAEMQGILPHPEGTCRSPSPGVRGDDRLAFVIP
ncbi:hypothetical protein MLD38_026281 [Melastoma candidum]|uniref:Uncharacterized protein n=1 Tax=Melastoma candidum TaxID=119954 RepID=A0ACB9P4Q1_9MYRT|nr:hypothetical protein MLD38_026281 [Melastoma candidum]